MVRDVYYQSPANPLQPDRLPICRTDLQLPYHPESPREAQQQVVAILLRLLLLAFAAMLCELLRIGESLRGRSSVLSPNLITLAFASYLVARTFVDRSTRLLKYPLAGGIAAWVFFQFPVPVLMHALLTATALGILTGLCGLHWTSYCTASPMSPERARQFRGSWQGFLSVMSLVPPLLLIAAYVLPPLLTGSLLVVIPAAMLIETRIRQGSWSACRAGWHALYSWLTYNRRDWLIPGTFQSPAGRWPQRMALTAACVFLTATMYLRLPLDSRHVLANWLYPIIPVARSWYFLTVEGSILWILALSWSLVIPLLITLPVPVCLTLPVLAQAARQRQTDVNAQNWSQLIGEIQQSEDPVQRDSVYLGRVVEDGSPLLVPRSIFNEHAHFLGDSGSGKTSRGLIPLLEQLIVRGNCSVVVIDLKADSMELLGSLQEAATQARQRTRCRMPVKYFTNQVGRPTFAFNPLLQPFWKDLELYPRTDIQCGALGLIYGSDYGEGYYGSANAAVMYQTMKSFPDTVTYRELAERVGEVVASADEAELHPEIRKAGVHVQTVLDRLGSFGALNVARTGKLPADVLEHAIDLTQLFLEPQLLYFHLSSTLAPGSSPEIARLVTYSLLAAATQVARSCQVYLVIDEFQRMVARNVEYMLQLARSMGVGVILANQSMQDLRTSKANLIPPIEANCRYRQWFSVSSAEDRRRLVEGSGETVDLSVSRTTSRGSNGRVEQSVTHSERILPRLSLNDVLLTSDHEKQSFVRISRGAGYAQYGGMPIRVEADFHITRKEHERRKATAWPSAEPGTFVPERYIPASTPPPPAPAAVPAGPSITVETISGSTPATELAAELFASQQGAQKSSGATSQPGSAKPRKKRGGRGQS